MAYEYRRHSELGTQLPFSETMAEVAPREELIGLFGHLESTLDGSGFFTAPDKRPTVINNLRTMLERGKFTSQEIRTLRGVISSIDRRHQPAEAATGRKRFLRLLDASCSFRL